MRNHISQHLGVLTTFLCVVSQIATGCDGKQDLDQYLATPPTVAPQPDAMVRLAPKSVPRPRAKFKPANHCARYRIDNTHKRGSLYRSEVGAGYKAGLLLEKEDALDSMHLVVRRNGRQLYRTKRPVYAATLQLGSSWGCHDGFNTDAELSHLGNDPVHDFDRRSLLRAKAARRWLIPGRDLTGNGRPNLAVFTNGGGNRSPWLLYLFETSPHFRFLLSQEISYGPDSAFVDLDRDGIPEIMNIETVEVAPFGKANAIGWTRVGLPVVFKLIRNRYRLSPRLMKKPPLPHTVLVSLAVTYQSSHTINLAEKILQLIATGRARQAQTLAILALADKRRGRAYYTHVVGHLEPDRYRPGSSYWTLLKRLNGGRL